MRKKTKENAEFQANDIQKMLFQIDRHIYSESIWATDTETVEEFRKRTIKFFNVREALKELLDELLRGLDEYKGCGDKCD